MTDNDLIDALRAGDKSALLGLYERYSEHLRHYISKRYFPRGTDHTEDVIQTTFVRVMECLHTYRATIAVRTWVFSLAGECAIEIKP